jgi:hypothetical protein
MAAADAEAAATTEAREARVVLLVGRAVLFCFLEAGAIVVVVVVVVVLDVFLYF